MHYRSCLIEYDTALYPFAKILARDVFHVPKIDQLHKILQRDKKRTGLCYQYNLSLRALMQKLPDNSFFYGLYHHWVANLLAPLYAGHIRYSTHPKMRVHLARTGSVSDYHYDADITGRPEQINCYLPFTDVYDGCTIHAESDYGNEDYVPLNFRYGQALIWDGGFLRHGSRFDDTDITRVSCDFRFHPLSPNRVQSPRRDIIADRPP